MKYPTTEIQFKYYGKHVELLIEEAIKEPDSTKRESLTIHILRLMKSFYQEWNRDAIETDTLLTHLKILSEGKLEVDTEKIQKYNLLEGRKKSYTNRRKYDVSNNQKSNSNSNNNYKRYSKRKKSS